MIPQSLPLDLDRQITQRQTHPHVVMRSDRTEESHIKFDVASGEGEDGSRRSVKEGGLSSRLLRSDIVGRGMSHKLVRYFIYRYQSCIRPSVQFERRKESNDSPDHPRLQSSVVGGSLVRTGQNLAQLPASIPPDPSGPPEDNHALRSTNESSVLTTASRARVSLLTRGTHSEGYGRWQEGMKG
jgi:hypothetical protein